MVAIIEARRELTANTFLTNSSLIYKLIMRLIPEIKIDTPGIIRKYKVGAS